MSLSSVQPTTFYPQFNPSQNAYGGGIAPLQSGATIRSEPGQVFAQQPTAQMSVIPQGNYSVAQGLALGQAAASPFATLADNLSNYLDPVKRATRQAQIAAAQASTGQSLGQLASQPLTNVVNNTMLRNRALLMNVDPNLVNSVTPPTHTDTKTPGMLPSTSTSFGSTLGSGSNGGNTSSTSTQSSQSIPNGGSFTPPTAPSTSPNPQVLTGTAADNISQVSPSASSPSYYNGYPNQPPSLVPPSNMSGSDALMAAKLGKTAEPEFTVQTDPNTGERKLIPNPRYGRQLSQIDKAEIALREQNVNKGDPTALDEDVKDSIAFQQSHPGAYDPKIDAQIKSFPLLLNSEAQLAGALTNPNFNQAWATQQGGKLANIQDQMPPIGPGLSADQSTAYHAFLTAKSNVINQLANITSAGRGVTRADLPLATTLAGGASGSIFNGAASAATIKERMGDQIASLQNAYQDYQKLGKYVNPEAMTQINQAAANLNKTLGNVYNMSDTQNVFASGSSNVTQPQTPSGQPGVGTPSPTGTNVPGSTAPSGQEYSTKEISDAKSILASGKVKNPDAIATLQKIAASGGP